MFKFNQLIQFILLLANISYALSQCATTLEEADKCGLKTSFFGNREAIVPTTEAELDTHCQEVTDGVKCVQNFVRTCLKGFVKQTSELALNNGAKHMDKRCSERKEREEFLQHVKCYTDKTKLEPLHVCADKNLAMLETFLTMDMDVDIGVGCCIFQLFEKCIHEANVKLCSEDTTEYWDNMISDISEDSMSFTCAGFESLDKCEKSLKPEVWNELKTIDAIEDPKTLSLKQKHKSGIALMIDFLKKLANE